VFVFSHFKDNLPEGPAEIHLQAQLANAPERAGRRHGYLGDRRPDGKELATTSQTGRIAASATGENRTDGDDRVAGALVAGDADALPAGHHRLRAAVRPSTGSRPSSASAPWRLTRTGVLLNGKPYLNSRAPATIRPRRRGRGAAGPPAVFSIAKLKEMGVNAYRTSHNSPTRSCSKPATGSAWLSWTRTGCSTATLLHLTWFENRSGATATIPAWRFWSLANEGIHHAGHAGRGRVAATMQRWSGARSDAAGDHNALGWETSSGHQRSLRGAAVELPYREDNMDAYHAAHPQQPMSAANRHTVGTPH